MQGFLAASAVGIASMAKPSQAAVGMGNVVNVGPSRDYTNVQAALAAITDASASKPYLILVDPGVYVIADGGGPITLKSYVSVAGMDRQTVVFIGDGNNNFRCASYVDLRNFTVEYTGSGNRSGALRSDIANLQDFHVDHLFITVDSYRPAIATHAYVDRAEIRDTTIVTQGVGIDIAAGGRVYIHDTNIHLFGTSTSAHLGIRGSSYCRIYVFGGKIGSGYGYGDLTDTTHDIIGVLADTNFSGRIVLHGIWSICRNDGAGTGINVNCVRVNGINGWVRIFGSYLQAENPTGSGAAKTLTNPGNGRIEIYGTRVREYGDGPTYSSNQIGLQKYDANNNNLVLVNDSGGLVLLDGGNGPFTLKLPYLPNTTEQYILKKADTSANAITINGNGRLIEGQASRTLFSQYETLHLRYGGDQYYIVG